MDQIRRNFLLGASASLSGAALAAPAAAVSTDEVALLSTYVTGTAYHHAVGAAAGLRAGDPLVLRRDRSNDYDPRAIEVRTRAGWKLGYLPRIHNDSLASLMDAGFPVSGRVSEVVPDCRQPDIRLGVFLSI
jgi:hypothetical protein